MAMYKRVVNRVTHYSIVPPRKRCPDCGRDLPVGDFGRNRTLKDGLQFYCRECCSRRGAEIYRRKRARLGKTVRERIAVPAGHKRCPGCQEIKPHSDWHRNRASRDGFVDRCKSCRRAAQRQQHLRKKFGLSVEEWARRSAEQHDLCAICRSALPTDTDHDHETGRLRGLLCNGCNLGLGHFRDDPDRLLSAVDYLARHGRVAKAPRRSTVIEVYPYRGLPIEVAGFRHSA